MLHSQHPIQVKESQEVAQDNSSNEANFDKVKYLRKFYFLLLIQLLIALKVSEKAQESHAFKRWVLNNDWLTLWTAVIIIQVINLIGLFKRGALSKYFGWACYLLQAISIAFFLSYIQVRTQYVFLIYILRIFSFVVVALFFHTLWIRDQLTFQSSSLYILGSVYLSTLWHLIFYQDLNGFSIYLTAFLATVWGFYLVWDQETVDDRKRSQNQEDAFLSGAILVYLDLEIKVLYQTEYLRQLLIKARV